MTLINHIFVVTGAGRGLGRAIAQTLAARSSEAETRHIVLVGRNRRDLESASSECISSTTRTYIIADFELSEPSDSWASVVLDKVGAIAQEATGPLRLTLVNNAGTLGDLSKHVVDYSAAEISEYATINFVSFSVLTGRFLGFAKKQNAERICVVNVSSLLAIMGFSNWGLYAAIKAARDQLLKVAALESQGDQRVKLLSYAPGPLDNDMQEVVRTTVGDPEQKQIYGDLHKEKKLVGMAVTAGIMCDLLDKWEFESGAHIDIYDVVPPPA
ncbi:sepiapterin reductase [Linderina pennispora]|uniref:Sepiapterin reductase n=1 Tax=Linderina pennispora TaxID=61395 RepID=A0A1Y1W8F5_9FUNG|nr:sepiapterin reductase [Linderina pennispora]ORX69454.1 sepiapterin reductase [Linderina pennispora]